MSDQPQPTSVQALVDAIDQRARQAGTEGATTVLRGLLGTVSDTLASIEARLEAIEGASGGEVAADPVLSGIDERLQSLNTRLGRLEEAFVRAVDDSSASTVSISDRVVEAVRAFMDERAAEALAATPQVQEGLQATQLDDIGDRLGGQIDRLGEQLDHRLSEQLGERLGQQLGDRLGDQLVQRLEEQIQAVARSVSQLSGRVEAQGGSSITPIDRAAGDKELRAALDRIAADVERLLRQEQSGRLVQLVEARIGAGIDAVVGRIEEIAAEIGGLATAIARSDECTGQAIDRLPALSEQLTRIEGELAAGSDRLSEQLGGRDERTAEELRQVSQRLDGLRSDLGGQVRSEAEQLTQRVAALAAAVERLRQSVDTLAEESAQTIGRKATEVGRRLAADWGLRSKRTGGDSNDRGRELGPGR